LFFNKLSRLIFFKADSGPDKKGPENTYVTAIANQIRSIACRNEQVKKIGSGRGLGGGSLGGIKDQDPQNAHAPLKKTAIKMAFYGFAAIILYRWYKF
jgi:hypothetical protein